MKQLKAPHLRYCMPRLSLFIKIECRSQSNSDFQDWVGYIKMTLSQVGGKFLAIRQMNIIYNHLRGRLYSTKAVHG